MDTCAADIDDVDGVNLADVPLFVQCLLAGGCGGGPPLCRRGDVNNDGAVTIADVAPFVGVLLAGTGTAQQVCAVDLGGPAYTIPGTPDGLLNGTDIQAFLDCLLGSQCPPAPPRIASVSPEGAGERKVVPLTPWVAHEPALQPRSGRALPAPGTFAMHGCPIDVLLDGLILQYNRARYYDVKNGRWLQRDGKGYVDGANLYHAFGGNAMRNSDPAGEQFYEPSDAEVMRWAGMSEPDIQEILAAQRQSEMDVAVGVAKGVYRVVSGTLSGLWQLVSSPRQTVSAIGGAWSGEYQSFRASGAGVADAVGATAADQVLILVGVDGVVSVLEGTDRLGNRLDLESSATALTESGIQAALVLVPASKAVTASSRPLLVLPERMVGESAAAATSERLMLAAGRAVPGSSLLAGTTIGKQLVFPFAERAPAVWAEPRSGALVIRPYGELSLDTSIPGQAHHLNQAAAYSDVIPIRQGMAIKLEGNIFTDVGAPHAVAHLYLEENFWRLYRVPGAAAPTNLQYTRALQQSLRAAGLSEAQVQQVVRAAIEERLRFGLLGGVEVPNIPHRIPNLAK